MPRARWREFLELITSAAALPLKVYLVPVALDAGNPSRQFQEHFAGKRSRSHYVRVYFLMVGSSRQSRSVSTAQIKLGWTN